MVRRHVVSEHASRQQEMDKKETETSNKERRKNVEQNTYRLCNPLVVVSLLVVAVVAAVVVVSPLGGFCICSPVSCERKERSLNRVLPPSTPPPPPP